MYKDLFKNSNKTLTIEYVLINSITEYHIKIVLNREKKTRQCVCAINFDIKNDDGSVNDKKYNLFYA